MSHKKTLLSGVKPTGKPHIGNYFGAMKQFVDFQDEYQSYFMIADYHALNFIQSADEMRELTLSLAMDYLAIGLDPKKCVIFKQSDVSAHTELTWIFDTITTMPYLMRAHAFKDAEAKNKEISVGTFNYPMLMAADILLYSPDIVPVGLDQKQHVEYTRDTAEKFNRTFNTETFKLPKPGMLETVQTVPGDDGRKMSKSYNNYLPLFATDGEIEKFVMGVKTDSGEGNITHFEPAFLRPYNLYAIHRLLIGNLDKYKTKSDLDQVYDSNPANYKKIKEILIEDLKTFISPMRDRREKIDPQYVLSVLTDGGLEARKIAEAKILEVKIAIGVN